MRPALLIATLWSAAIVAAEPKPPAEPKDVPPCPSSEEKPDVEKLVRRTEQLLQGRTSVGVMTMSIKTPAWSRKLKMKIWSTGQDFALIRVVEGGPRETGMMTLKREKQLWNYLPQAGRVMKLPSGMLGDAWMGSDFTNDDLVKGSSITRDFDSKVEGLTDLGGKKAWHIVLVPKKDAVVVWGKVEMDIEQATCAPLQQRFFDEEGKLARRMEFSDFRKVGWRLVPGRMTVFPGEAGRETSIDYDSIDFDVDIPDDTYSVHRLQQGR